MPENRERRSFALTKGEVIQINATIITGILILLTFQSVTSTPLAFSELSDWDKALNKLNLERQKIAKQILSYEIELENMAKGTSAISSLDNVHEYYPDRLKDTQVRLDDLYFLQKEVNVNIETIEEKIEEYKEDHLQLLSDFIAPENLVRNIATAIIFPFAVSAIFESIMAVRESSVRQASKIGISLMVFGFIIIVIGLLTIISALASVSEYPILLALPEGEDKTGYLIIGLTFMFVLPALVIIVVVWKVKKYLREKRRKKENQARLD